jgi:hypothetical protein
MTMVLPACALEECLLAAVATIFDRLTAIAELVIAITRTRAFGGLTWAVDLGHHEASQNNLVEGGIGTACFCQHTTRRANSEQVLTSQELVQTHQQLDVGVGGLGDLCILVNPRARFSCCV